MKRNVARAMILCLGLITFLGFSGILYPSSRVTNDTAFAAPPISLNKNCVGFLFSCIANQNENITSFCKTQTIDTPELCLANNCADAFVNCIECGSNTANNITLCAW